VDYLKPSGAIGFYHPDWVAVQKAAKEEINWILETKGRIWEGTEAKEEAIKQWCERITEQTGKLWKFFRINQVGFESKEPKTLMEIVKGSEPREGKLV
jgi:type III restriction enzyme